MLIYKTVLIDYLLSMRLTPYPTFLTHTFYTLLLPYLTGLVLNLTTIKVSHEIQDLASQSNDDMQNYGSIKKAT